MIEREIRCASALTPGGWISPARIRIDQDGLISAVSQLRGAGMTGNLAGPVLPGMPNLHSHAFQRQMAGLTEDGAGQADNFWTWREAMYRQAQHVTPMQLQSLAGWLQAEMLEAGFTSCAEFHYLHHQPGGKPYDNLVEMSASLLNACARSGISMTLLPVLYCRSGFSSGTVSERQRRFFNTPDRYLELLAACHSLIAPNALHRLGIAPHSLRAVAAGQMREVLSAAESKGLPVHIHIAEQAAEVEQCLEELGARPLDWLLQNFPVDARWCLVHATHLDSAELEQAAASGAVAGLCPTTEADLGDGFFDAAAWMAAGGQFGVGSDSNLRVSACEELRLLEFGCRLRAQKRNILADEGKSCGRSLYERAAAGGAMALGQNIGRIAPGCRADLVELDLNHPLLGSRSGDAIVDTWLFAGGNAMVRTVWVGGVRCVAGGRHVRRDELLESFRRTMKELS
ncbi:MAG TPA: formimidoylglutamate deiminase [Xanthomonadales bacterium]|nr:formimidoylglutamate deiminase [Xanthomonadales bacterium]